MLVSFNRTIYMGFAILWVMAFHLGLFSLCPIVNKIANLGYLGVDIFMFLSAYGLTYSFSKNNQYWIFYKKRFLRIIPTYCIVLFIAFLFSTDFSYINVIKFVQELCMIGYFFPCLSWSFHDWYIPSICFFYILFPFLYNFLLKRTFLVYVMISILASLLSLIICYCNVKEGCFHLPQLVFFTQRIPIFLLGIYWAFLQDRFEIFIKKNYIICFIVAILSFLFILNQAQILNPILNAFIGTMPFILVLPGLFLFLDKLNNNTKIHKILYFAGTYSLELYLIHSYCQNIGISLVNEMTVQYLSNTSIIYHIVLYNGFMWVSLFVSFLLAFFFKKSINVYLTNSHRICISNKFFHL